MGCLEDVSCRAGGAAHLANAAPGALRRLAPARHTTRVTRGRATEQPQRRCHRRGRRGLHGGAGPHSAAVASAASVGAGSAALTCCSRRKALYSLSSCRKCPAAAVICSSRTAAATACAAPRRLSTCGRAVAHPTPARRPSPHAPASASSRQAPKACSTAAGGAGPAAQPLGARGGGPGPQARLARVADGGLHARGLLHHLQHAQEGAAGGRQPGLRLAQLRAQRRAGRLHRAQLLQPAHDLVRIAPARGARAPRRAAPGPCCAPARPPGYAARTPRRRAPCCAAPGAPPTPPPLRFCAAAQAARGAASA